MSEFTKGQLVWAKYGSAHCRFPCWPARIVDLTPTHLGVESFPDESAGFAEMELPTDPMKQNEIEMVGWMDGYEENSKRKHDGLQVAIEAATAAWDEENPAHAIVEGQSPDLKCST